FLICELDNGKSYKYDMNFVITEQGAAIDPLKDIEFFKKVFIESGALTWPNGYEIHADTVERDGKLIINYQEA
ncbi:DUF2442 domain-containing protein, partial [Bacteriovoracaceae bacterium]|nr:DUF2442 domain-containing protein [Bacteriovoracaceae bacterium]